MLDVDLVLVVEVLSGQTDRVEGDVGSGNIVSLVLHVLVLSDLLDGGTASSLLGGDRLDGRSLFVDRSAHIVGSNSVGIVESEMMKIGVKCSVICL